LSLQSREKEEADGIGASAVRAGMQAIGYIEHENLVLEVRHARGDRTQLRSLAAELVAARVQVIVAVGTQATDAAREATTSIPIIMAAVGDPLGSGFVQSLARPGGNVTGIANWSPEAAAKQLELLKEAVPRGILGKRRSLRAQALAGVPVPKRLAMSGLRVPWAGEPVPGVRKCH